MLSYSCLLTKAFAKKSDVLGIGSRSPNDWLSIFASIGLVCCDSWGHKELNTTEQLN